MATTPWAIPTGKAITGATYIKDTDNNIAATIEDLVDWCNNANGTYNDYTLTGLRTDFLSVSTAQVITSVKTVDTLGAIDFTGGELRIGGVAVTSTAAELNVLDGIPATLTATELGYVDGVTSAIQTQIDGKASLTGATFTGQVKGITPVNAEDLTRKDYVDTKTANITSGTYTPTATGTTNMTSVSGRLSNYSRNGDIVTITGSFGATTSTTGSAVGKITLPISLPSTNFLSVLDASGTVTSDEGDAGVAFASVSASTIQISMPNISVATPTIFYFSISYKLV